MYFVKDKSKYFALKIWTNLKQKSFQCSRTDTFCLMHFCLKHMLKKQCFWLIISLKMLMIENWIVPTFLKTSKMLKKNWKKRLTWCIRLFNSVISFFSVPCKKAHKACGYLKFLWYWADESLWLPLNGTSVHRRLTTSISLYPIISGRTKTM